MYFFTAIRILVSSICLPGIYRETLATVSVSQKLIYKTKSYNMLYYKILWLQADLFSGAIFITQAFKGLNLYVAVIILLAIAALFTISGKSQTYYL